MNVEDTIEQQIKNNPVVLYMKGSPEQPQCGFSANAINILNACGVKNLFTVDVLQDQEIRQGIKDYSDWPTIPQLYVKGEFIGGSDILTEMYQNGELQKLFEDN
ncbi:monothiol glutaredoxin [Nitrosomonas marina]|uniref:Glutaredoxin n=1 Tax=Nitrosomonas marina TaxID=917 RepID=A0A1I0D6D2_9PROT|nr:Grx4 family monothiol glutaredoxin [Nitrosomonas marina]SET27046.1 monothiol glutaredoxin [Nitrosomonas marina]